MLPAVTEVDPERDEIKIEPKRDCPFEAGSDVLLAAEEDTKGNGSGDQNENEDAFHLISGAKLLRVRIRALDPAELKEEMLVSYSRHWGQLRDRRTSTTVKIALKPTPRTKKSRNTR